MKKYILALDQGTSSSRAILFNKTGDIVSIAAKPFRQIYPQPGWVEQDPIEIWQSQLEVAQRAIKESGAKVSEIASIGITNQRETTVLWDRETGRPIHNAIVWQCRRTASECERLKEQGWERIIQEKTGLMLDAYFSGTKVQWILSHVPQARQMADSGRLLFGTVDSWLIFNLTNRRLHITDPSNASRTLLFNIYSLDWDREILTLLDIPPSLLPTVRDSSEVYGETDARLFGIPIPVASCIGDQQAALFGQACFSPGLGKNTYGTGCFLLMNVGKEPVFSRNKLLTTVAWRMSQKAEYALEGSVFVAGAVVQWLRDELGLIANSSDSEHLAEQAGDTRGVCFLPAFVGMGAPHWNMFARGMICGLTRDTSKAQIVRAALESIAFQTQDLLNCFEQDSGVRFKELRVDGGASTNDFLCQFQADISNLPVVRPRVTETTALGAAYLAGLAINFWRSRDQIQKHWVLDKEFVPLMHDKDRQMHLRHWRALIEAATMFAAKIRG